LFETKVYENIIKEKATGTGGDSLSPPPLLLSSSPTPSLPSSSLIPPL